MAGAVMVRSLAGPDQPKGSERHSSPGKWKRGFIVRRTLSLALLLVLVLAGVALAGTFKMAVIDVGQGDSILLTMPNGKTLLVDSGPPDGETALFSYLSQAGVTSLGGYLQTHAHNDHSGNATTLLGRYPVGVAYDPGYAHTTATFENYLRTIERQKIPLKLARKGQTIDLDPEVKVQVLWPTDAVVKSTQDVNETSIVLKLTYGQVSFLLMGDAPGNFIMGSDLKAQVLKVSHHGSRKNTDAAFLKAVGGKTAIISVGAGNTYGHPHQETLSLLKSFGYQTYRTDQSGTVVVATDGKSYSISTEKKGMPATGPPVANVAPWGKYVGSRNSQVFHLSTCRFAQNIKPENLVVFESREAAINAGRRPCAVCKP